MVQRREIAVCIILSLITCGFYSIYWFICLTDDTNYITGHQDTSGGMAFLLSLITCRIYSLYWMYKQGEKLDNAKTAHGIPSSNSGILYLVLDVFGFGIVSYALMQDSINKLA